MNAQNKDNIVNLLNSIMEMFEHLENLKPDDQNTEFYLELSYEAISSVNTKYNQFDNQDYFIKDKLFLLNSMILELNNCTDINKNDFVDIKESIKEIIQLILNQQHQPLILFLPYKYSMWDSFQSVHDEFKIDPNFKVDILPIPYYKVDDGKMTMVCEKNLFTNENIKVENYEEYDIQSKSPDIIFIHNIYDDNNLITRVHNKFFTEELKKTGAKIIYIPYYLSSFVPFEKNKGFYPYILPSIDNIDAFIVMNNYEKEIAELEGISSEKVFALGSPKIDYVLSRTKKNTDKVDKEKNIILLDTECMFFSPNPFKSLRSLLDALNIPKYNDKYKVIWRPHPLTESSILKFAPFFVYEYREIIKEIENNNFFNVSIDLSSSYLNALSQADIYIGQNHSLLNLSINLRKKIILMDENVPQHSLIPKEMFIVGKTNFYEIIKGSNEICLNKNADIIDYANQINIYLNNDGSCGKKIYNLVLSNFLT